MYVELTDQGVSIIRLTKIRLKKERTDEEHQDVFVGLFRNKSFFFFLFFSGRNNIKHTRVFFPLSKSKNITVFKSIKLQWKDDTLSPTKSFYESVHNEIFLRVCVCVCIYTSMSKKISCPCLWQAMIKRTTIWNMISRYPSEENMYVYVVLIYFNCGWYISCLSLVDSFSRFICTPTLR